MNTYDHEHYTRSPASWIAGSSAIGKRHTTNQDAFCIAVQESTTAIALLAVADGVSSATGAELASAVAVESVVEATKSALSRSVPINLAFVSSFATAHQAVMEAKVGGSPSACTLICAYLAANSITVANIGDSRAYWISDDGNNELLSIDDSVERFRQEQSHDQNKGKSLPSHAITKWLGHRATNISPTVQSFQTTSSGWLLLCTDGLWNYANSANSMATLLKSLLAHSSQPAYLAHELVLWANEQGGKDNITVVLARVEL